jgi:hypothetical protein
VVEPVDPFGHPQPVGVCLLTRDSSSTYDPKIVKKRQRRFTGIGEIVLSLTAKVARQSRQRSRRAQRPLHIWSNARAVSWVRCRLCCTPT